MAKLNLGATGDGSINIDDLTSTWTDGGPCSYAGPCIGAGQIMDACSGVCHEPNSGDYSDLSKAYHDVLVQLGLQTGAGTGQPATTKSFPTWAWLLVGGVAVIAMVKK